MQAYGTLTFLFSLSFLFSGVLEMFFALKNKDKFTSWPWYLMGGIFNSIIGILLLSNPAISALVLPFIVGFTLLFRSIQGLGFAFELKNYGNLRWGNLAIASVLGIVFSVILLVNPVFTGISIVIFMALALIFVGISVIVLSFQLKKIKNLPAKMSKELREEFEDKLDDLEDVIEDLEEAYSKK